MMIIILIAVLVCLFILGGGAAVWFVLRQRRTFSSEAPVVKKATKGKPLPFRWKYLMLPLAILTLTVILVAYFYRLLPVEVAYLFESDGSPDRWVGRGMISLWMLLPQLFFTLLAGAITWGITKVSALFSQPENTRIQPGRILLLMGNMVALPQLILCFAMLDIFSYNAYQIHLIPLWAFALIVMGLGGVVIGIFFIQAISQAWRANQPNP